MKKTQYNTPAYISPALETVSLLGSEIICQSNGNITPFDRSEDLDNSFEN